MTTKLESKPLLTFSLGKKIHGNKPNDEADYAGSIQLVGTNNTLHIGIQQLQIPIALFTEVFKNYRSQQKLGFTRDILTLYRRDIQTDKKYTATTKTEWRSWLKLRVRLFIIHQTYEQKTQAGVMATL